MGDLHRQALARDLARRLMLASHDELRVVDRIFMRLELGRERYGQLAIGADDRDWRRERSDELLDAVVYDTIEQIRADDLAHANLQAAAAEELAELERWRDADQRTIASNVPAQIALRDIAEPYDDLAIAEFGGEAG